MNKDMKLETRLLIKLAGEPGFEPGLDGPEPSVLPLDYSPKTYLTELKSSPLPGLLNDMLPSILPQKAARIGQLLQSQLSNPRLAQYQILAQLLLKYHPLKLISPPRQSLYMLPTTPERPLLQAVPLSRHAFDATERASATEAALTLPESITEVALC